MAYNAATGAQEWVSRYNGPANQGDSGAAIAVDVGGTIAYVTGGSQGKTTGEDIVTIAYNGATGAQLWAQRDNVAGKSADVGLAVALPPDEGDGPVIVTGQTTPVGGKPTDVTIDYNARTGQRKWVSQFKALGSFAFDPVAMTLNPEAERGYVGGVTGLASAEPGYGVVAFNTVTGAVAWRNHYAGPADGNSLASGLVVGPRTGGTLYETGASDNVHGVADFATIAYAAR